MDSLLRDLKYAIRRLTKAPVFSVTAVLIVALGIGANTAMFSFVNAMLFRPQPFKNPHEMVDIYQDSDEGDPGSNSFPAYRDMTDYSDVFAGVAASYTGLLSFQTQDGVRPAIGEYVTANYFAVLGLKPSMGRWFEEDEGLPGAAPVAVLSQGAWQAKFGADPEVIGETVRLNGAPVTIVGIGPVGYNSLSPAVVIDFWLSLSCLPSVAGNFAAGTLERRQDHWFMVKARLNPGVTASQAQASMNGLANRLATDFPNLNKGRDITVFASEDVRIHPMIDPFLLPGASLLMAVVGLVLMIACSNLAILLLVRGASRAKDLFIRMSLGATRRQLTRHLLTESLLLSAAGGLLGYVMAAWALRLITTFEAPLPLPVTLDLILDHRVLAFTIFLSLLTGIAFGLAPALKATRTDLASTLRDGGDPLSSSRGWFSLKNALVVFQVAVSFLLLVGAGLFIRSLTNAQNVDVGFNVDKLAILKTDATQAGYSLDEAQGFYKELLRRIETIPGVESAARAARPPISGFGGSSTLILEGYQSPSGTGAVEVAWAYVGPSYFETLQIPILQGRGFTDADHEETVPVAVINETMARRYWGRLEVVGRRFRYQADEDSWVQIVGVARDTRVFNVIEDPRDLFYRPLEQQPSAAVSFLVRSSQNPSSLLAPMRRELRQVESRLTVLGAKTMAEHLG
ncbi:MAG: ABC transporter permease, partial [Acidobacteriota bacterium]